MGLDSLFTGFLQPIAVGAAAVFALLLLVWLGIPPRSPVRVSRRATK